MGDDRLDLLEARASELDLLDPDDVFDPEVDGSDGACIGAGLDPGSRWSDCAPDGLLGDMLAERAASVASIPDDTDGWETLERVDAWERVIAWAQACQIREMAGFVEDAEARPAGGQRPHEAVESAIAEVGLALCLSSRAANARVDEALTLARRLPATLAALQHGHVSLPAARAVMDQTTHLTDAEVGRVERQVLPKIAGRTTPQIRQLTRRAVLKTDPDAATRRQKQQRRERKVSLHQEPDGMATLSLFGPAPDVVGVYGIVNEHARAAGSPDDERTMDARRADALVDLVVNGADPRPTSAGKCGTPNDGLPEDETVGGVGGAGDRGEARRAADGAGGSGGDPARDSGTDAARSPKPWSRPRAGRPLVQVTVSLATLLGLNNEPGELAGYGPITAEIAREIAADATWRRLVTDPVTGALLDSGTTRYTPPASLARHVIARDQTCRYPGCRVPASRCDVDHGVPFDAGGPTNADNLTAKCRKHHRLKQMPGWDVSQDSDGSLTWTTPSSHTYTTVPPPVSSE